MTQLTSLQKLQIAELIDRWYFEWKDRVVKQGTPHSLGFAKEELKSRFERLEL